MIEEIRNKMLTHEKDIGKYGTLDRAEKDIRP